MWSNQIFYCQLKQLKVPVNTRSDMRCLSPPCGQLQCTAVMNKNAKRKPHVIRQHMYNILFFSFFLNQEEHIVALNVKMLIPLAAASLAVTSCSYSSFSSVCFKLAQVLSCFWRTLNRFLLTFQNIFLREVSCCWLCKISNWNVNYTVALWVIYLEMQQEALMAEYFFSVEQVKKKVSVHPSEYLTM